MIPDAKTIAEAKAKREAARAKSTAADYVDLDSSGGRRERVAFKSVRDGGARDRYAGYVEGDILPGSDDDEFERAQLQRVFRDEPEMRRSARDARATMERAGTGVSIERGGMEAFESLKRALEAAESSSETARREATRADENAVKSQEALAFYEKELKDASERYVFTQKLRDYFRDACAMLHEKKLILDELEEHYRKFHAERAQALTQAMNAEFEESAIEAEAAAEAVNAVLQRGGSQTEAKATAVTAIRDAVFNAKGLHGEKLDDMGRDLNIAMREKVKARSKRRESSDTAMAVAEDEREVGLFHKDWADARDAASSMLKDASEEFSTLSAVKRHAEEWKRTHLGSYKSTYMSVSVPNLFAPFVRLELIGWSPLFPLAGKTAPGALDAMSWYGQLFDYGVIDGKIDEGDEDANLLPNMVQHVVLPIASEAVEEWWEPRDPAQSRALASTLKDIFVYVEPSANEEAKEIVIALQRRLKRCAEECAVPTYSPIVATCAPNAARHAQARFRLALDLARSAFAFEDLIVDRAALQRIVADGIIGAHVIPYVRLQLVDPAACAASLQAVVDVLPADWLRAAPPAVAPARDVVRRPQAIDRARRPRGVERRRGDRGDREVVSRVTDGTVTRRVVTSRPSSRMRLARARARLAPVRARAYRTARARRARPRDATSRRRRRRNSATTRSSAMTTKTTTRRTRRTRRTSRRHAREVAVSIRRRRRVRRRGGAGRGARGAATRARPAGGGGARRSGSTPRRATASTRLRAAREAARAFVDARKASWTEVPADVMRQSVERAREHGGESRRRRMVGRRGGGDDDRRRIGVRGGFGRSFSATRERARDGGGVLLSARAGSVWVVLSAILRRRRAGVPRPRSAVSHLAFGRRRRRGRDEREGAGARDRRHSRRDWETCRADRTLEGRRRRRRGARVARRQTTKARARFNRGAKPVRRVAHRDRFTQRAVGGPRRLAS